MTQTTYTVEDIFTDIPDDPDNVLMTIPPEIMENMGLSEGDNIDVSVENGGLILVKIDT
jgi:AbrB family looped-hinge helix DNA binding protein